MPGHSGGAARACNEHSAVDLVVDVFNALNERIRFLYDRDHQLGHSYFLDVSDAASLRQVFSIGSFPCSRSTSTARGTRSAPSWVPLRRIRLAETARCAPTGQGHLGQDLRVSDRPGPPVHRIEDARLRPRRLRGPRVDHGLVGNSWTERFRRRTCIGTSSAFCLSTARRLTAPRGARRQGGSRLGAGGGVGLRRLVVTEHTRIERRGESDGPASPGAAWPHGRLYDRLRASDRLHVEEGGRVFEWGDGVARTTQWVGVVQIPGAQVEILPKVDTVAPGEEIGAEQGHSKPAETFCTCFRSAATSPFEVATWHG